MKRFILPIAMLIMACGAVAGGDRAAGTLDCSIGQYEAFLDIETNYFDGGLPYFFHGTLKFHSELTDAFSQLSIDGSRLNIVLVNINSGDLFVYYCKNRPCSKFEISYTARAKCSGSMFSTGQCIYFATRIEDADYCFLAPSLKQ